jgi:hypothetical protein
MMQSNDEGSNGTVCDQSALDMSQTNA